MSLNSSTPSNPVALLSESASTIEYANRVPDCRPLSKLAVVSLPFSLLASPLVFYCPLMSTASIFLIIFGWPLATLFSLIALMRIYFSRGRVRGMWLVCCALCIHAITAIIVAIFLSHMPGFPDG
jgi:hypothetical protein